MAVVVKMRRRKDDVLIMISLKVAIHISSPIHGRLGRVKGNAASR